MSKSERRDVSDRSDKPVTFRSAPDFTALIDKLAAKRGYDRSQVIRYGMQIVMELAELEPDIIRPYADRNEARAALRALFAKHIDKPRKS